MCKPVSGLVKTLEFTLRPRSMKIFAGINGNVRTIGWIILYCEKMDVLLEFCVEVFFHFSERLIF